MFSVFAETLDGRQIVLARGFASLDEAEEHPVRLKDYARVWADLDDDHDATAAARSIVDVSGASRDDLEFRVEQIEAALRDDSWVPKVWRLTAIEVAVLNALTMRKVANRSAVLSLVYGDRIDDYPAEKIVDVYICKLRRKLRGFGIQIDTRWGQGFELDQASRNAIERLKRGERPESLLQGSALPRGETRPVKPIGLPAKLRPATIAYDRPDVRMASPAELMIESAYQRDLSERSLRLIRKIVANWNWAKFKLPVVAETAEGLFLIDGQHTAIAAASHPQIVAIPVMVVPAETLEERADAFVAQNRDRIAMSAHQVFHAEAAAGAAKARRIVEIAAEVGATIPRTMPQPGKAKAGAVAGIVELQRCMANDGEDVLRRVISIAVLAGLAPLTSRVARALRFLLTDPAHASAARLPDHAIAAAVRELDMEGGVAHRAKSLGVSRAHAAADLLAAACEAESARAA